VNYMENKKTMTDDTTISIISENKDDKVGLFSVNSNVRGWLKFQIVLIIILLIFMYFVGNPGQWILGLVIIFLIGFNIVSHLYDKSEHLDLWKRKNTLDDIVHLKISRISDVAERAFKGNKLSQAILEEKLIDEFLFKISEERNLTRAEVEGLLDDPEELNKLIGDDELSKFLLKGKSLKKVLQNVDEELMEEKKNIGKKSLNVEYKNKIERLMKKMEEWK